MCDITYSFIQEHKSEEKAVHMIKSQTLHCWYVFVGHSLHVYPMNNGHNIWVVECFKVDHAKEFYMSIAAKPIDVTSHLFVPLPSFSLIEAFEAVLIKSRHSIFVVEFNYCIAMHYDRNLFFTARKYMNLNKCTLV